MLQHTTEAGLATPAYLQGWTPRGVVQSDRITATPMRALSASLNRSDPEPRHGAELPPLWHWLYFWPSTRLDEINEDGNRPRDGGIYPPIPLPRRMWAGGRLEWHRRLRVGDEAERTTRIESVTHKAGRSGELAFVVVRHEIRVDGELSLVEEQDLVYRAAHQEGEAPVAPRPAERGAPWQRQIVPDPVLLLRYSALIFNGHRIHYDRPYTQQVEGYPGLVVHGPLIATLLADLVRREQPTARLRRFEYKAIRPTFDMHAFHVNGQPNEGGGGAALWACDHEGWLTMQAVASFAAG